MKINKLNMSTINKELDVINKVKSNKIPFEFSNKRNLDNIIKNIFNHELKEEFQNILISSKDNFINSVKQKVFSILILKYTNKFLTYSWSNVLLVFVFVFIVSELYIYLKNE